MRFLFPVLPLLNLGAAVALARLWISCRKSWLRAGALLGVLGLLAASALATGLMLWASSHNYPGGHALQELHCMYAVCTTSSTITSVILSQPLSQHVS